MAATKTEDLIPVTRKFDRVRERELFRFYRPQEAAQVSAHDNQLPLPSSDVTGPPVSSDPTYTALAQLVSLRLNIERCVLSVVDHQTSYILAESTRTLSLADTTQSDEAKDRLIWGCSTVGRHMAMCDYVIRLPVTPDRHSIFIVPDLTKDERFRESPVVKGGPSFKFYAGVPITTEKGVNIGGLGIWDTVTREPLTENQISFMTQIASTIMINLETRKHAEDRKKISRMSRGLHSFVEGKDHIVSEVLMPMPEREKPSRTSAIIQDATIVEEEVSDSYRNIQKIIRGSVSGDQQSSGSESDASRLSKKPQEKKEQTLCRAVNLLRDSLNLQSSGGVVFLDTSVMTRHSELRYVDHLAVEDTTDINSSAQNSDFGTKDDILATVLAKSDAILLNPQSTSCSIPQKQLQKLIRRYPRGKMWSFDEEALLSSSEEEQSSQSPQLKSSRVSDSSARLRLRQSEARMLQSAFPNAHCIMFVPLWDSALSKYGSTCFCFSTSLFQSFNQADDLTYIKAFSNSVSAEISRLATIDADQKKSDFIGSISHELRSPLHGVLASAEFLSETDCDAFQTSLIDTIDSCGRTLLDTINHVLDYSRINAFEKTWKRKRRLKYGKHGEAPAPLPGLLSIFCKTDVAAVTEEVVEGIFAGQVYSGTSSADISELSSTTNTRRLDRTASQPSPTMAGKKGPQVEVVIDISAGNFSFQTQPGAIRRVIMNIFSNALKYTERGMILVQLRQEELPFKLENEKHEGNLIVLTITDTGKGISSSYLRSQLFTPFAQENTLAPGTGLGLSIVKSIVTMLGGTIDIFSRTSGDRKSGSDEPASGLRRGSLSSNLGQGTGTEVQIRLPLSRLSSSDNTKSTNSSIISFDRIHDGSISKLQTLEAKKTMALFGFNEAVAPARIETRRVLEQYILEWFQLTYIPNWRDEHADIVILDEDDLTIFSNSYPKPSYTSAIILSAHLNRHEKPPVDCETFQYVSKPFGPFKLAKAVRIAVAKTRQGGGTPSPPPTAHTAAPAVFLPSPGLQNLTIGDAQDTIPVLAHSGSENAHIAMATPLEERRDNQTAQFPFPDQYIDESNTEKTESNPQQLTDGVKPEQSPAAEDGSLISETPKLGSPALKQPLVSAGLKGNPKLPLKTIQEAPLPTHLPSKSPVTAALPFRPKAPLVVAPNVVETPEAVEASSPKVLLVDDNSINLMLLETFMKKRKWVDIDKAENGLLAVQAAEVRQYSVIFMDISMPVLNGFDATRRIRAIEDQRRQDLKKQSPFSTLVDVKGNPIISKFKPALIIALTGLASSKDQSEALTCGMDLFMTKPVSFKEVGRLLDNWEVEAGKA